MKPYIPIACGNYDELEALSVTGRDVEVKFFLDGSIVEETGKIVDIFPRDKAEYLRLHSGTEIRLDDVLSVNGKLFSSSCSTEK